MMSFISGKFDITLPVDVTVPLLKNIAKDAPKAQCTMRSTGVAANVMINREKPPFDDEKIRRAMALTIDRQVFMDILNEGQGQMSGAMLPPPEGLWGLTPERLKPI